jgi:uncharacterized protein (UPF0297 family)
MTTQTTKMDRRILLARVKEALDRGFSPTRLGYLASGDPLFVKKLKAGHPFKITTMWRAFDTINEFDKPRHAWVAQGRRKSPSARGRTRPEEK